MNSPDLLDDGNFNAQADLAAALREVLEAGTAMVAPSEQLAQFAESARDLAARMAPFPRGERPFMAMEVLCTHHTPVGGQLNPVFPVLDLVVDLQDPNKLRGRIHMPFHYEGPPGVVHGGMVSAIHDQIVASFTRHMGCIAATASLKVQYFLPTPSEQTLEWSAWCIAEEGRKLTIKSSCECEGRVLSECEALLIKVGAQAYR